MLDQTCAGLVRLALVKSERLQLVVDLTDSFVVVEMGLVDRLEAEAVAEQAAAV